MPQVREMPSVDLQTDAVVPNELRPIGMFQAVGLNRIDYKVWVMRNYDSVQCPTGVSIRAYTGPSLALPDGRMVLRFAKGRYLIAEKGRKDILLWSDDPQAP